MKSYFVLLLAVSILAACGSKPKVIESSSPVYGSTDNSAAPYAHQSSQTSGDAHTVVCQDFMNTDKYTYMEVKEDGDPFWIAIPRQAVEKGATYTYSGGLMKNNFYSQEFDRTFPTIVLVSSISREGQGALDEAYARMGSQNPGAAGSVNKAPSEGLVKISDLFDKPQDYDGKVVTVSGTCVKINKMIMGRNWIHIDDGSMDGDLTITSMDEVPVGATASFTGTIGLNRDFGAGYRYEVIMENAHLEK